MPVHARMGVLQRAASTIEREHEQFARTIARDAKVFALPYKK